MGKLINYGLLAVVIAAVFGAHSPNAQAQGCVSQLQQQKIQMLDLAEQCNVRASLLNSIDEGQRVLTERDCRRPVGVMGQLDSFTECARVYLCAAQAFNCAIRRARQGQDCNSAAVVCLQSNPVPQ